MKVEVQVISNEIIKPSSPTPEKLRYYQLSFLDQAAPKTYNPLILFYELKNDHESKITEISEQIKKSLSEVLTLYHPFSGRVNNDRFVDCNDEGIAYSEARVNLPVRVNDIVEKANPSDLNKLLPLELHELTEFPVSVRFNIFSGGGIAVGVCISHQLADALSCISFIKNWAAVSCGGRVERPQFVSAKLFPWKAEFKFDPSAGVTKAAVSKRFTFEAAAIEALRSKYVDKAEGSGKPKPPTRIEALSTFIWSRFLAANRDEFLGGPEIKVYAVLHPVNLRRKLDPPLPDIAVGNIARLSIRVLPASLSLSHLESDEEGYGYEMVREIRKGIEKVDMDYVKKVREGEDENLEMFEEEAKRASARGGQLIAMGFTSLCRFPLYEADFGWGEPLWVSSATLSFSNIVTFMDAKNGNAIEAYISLKAEQLAKLEADQGFLKYVKAN